MTPEKHNPNNVVQYEPTEYKHTNCMGRGCNNVAAFNVNLAVVKRSGDFCYDCTRYFEERNLVVSRSTIDLGIGEGKIVKVTSVEKEDSRGEYAMGVKKQHVQ